jgi:peptidylprolyl isomerase
MLTALVLAGAFAKVEITEIKVGKGDAAKKGDVLTMLYKGTLKNGKIFDETTAKEPPYAFKLGAKQVIDGWEQGLVGIKVGGKRKLKVPYQLAYGENGYADIPAKADLTFVVELIRLDNDQTIKKLAIKETQVGKGPAAESGDTVKIHYTGKFLNGFQFDSSVGGDPYSVVLGAGKVIKGFDQGIVGMRKGGKRKVTIPYAMAYKEDGRPPVIPRMATLVFDLELIELKESN